MVCGPRKLTIGAIAVALIAGGFASPVIAATASAPLIIGIGDSYTSGVGAPPYDASKCYRSQASSYPVLAAAALGYQVRNIACSGADTQDVQSEYQGEPSQVGRIADADWVVMTIGGNDPDLLGNMTKGSAGVRAIAAKIPATRQKVQDVLQKVKAAAPHAEVAILTHSDILPQTQEQAKACLGDDAAKIDVAGMHQQFTAFNAAIAAAAKATGAHLVDVASAFRGHDMCSTTPWIENLAAEGAEHPNVTGYTHMASMVAKAIDAVDLSKTGIATADTPDQVAPVDDGASTAPTTGATTATTAEGSVPIVPVVMSTVAPGEPSASIAVGEPSPSGTSATSGPQGSGKASDKDGKGKAHHGGKHRWHHKKSKRRHHRLHHNEHRVHGKWQHGSTSTTVTTIADPVPPTEEADLSELPQDGAATGSGSSSSGDGLPAGDDGTTAGDGGATSPSTTVTTPAPKVTTTTVPVASGANVCANSATVLEAQPTLKHRAEQITSSFENSTLTLKYDYAEDIGDGNGITAGRAGFTSGTSDLLQLVKDYTAKKPGNGLAKYVPALEKVDGSDSHDGLDGFEAAFKKEAANADFRAMQDHEVDVMYFCPAMDVAQKSGIKTALGQAIIFDTWIQHGGGGGNGGDGIIAATGKNGSADETAWLKKFLENRRSALYKMYPNMADGKSSSDSRVDALLSMVTAKKWNLDAPLTWTAYGEPFTISK